MNEKLEYLSRQHVDFRTTEGMRKILQTVTWRVKIEVIHILYTKITIYVRKKKMPIARRFAKKFGIMGREYIVKEIGWFECWFKRFRVVEIKMLCGELPGHTVKNEIIKPEKQWCAFDHSLTIPPTNYACKTEDK